MRYLKVISFLIIGIALASANVQVGQWEGWVIIICSGILSGRE